MLSVELTSPIGLPLSPGIVPSMSVLCSGSACSQNNTIQQLFCLKIKWKKIVIVSSNSVLSKILVLFQLCSIAISESNVIMLPSHEYVFLYCQSWQWWCTEHKFAVTLWCVESIVAACDPPCLNGGTCYSKQDPLEPSSKLYMCYCTEGFHGLSCEKERGRH